MMWRLPPFMSEKNEASVTTNVLIQSISSWNHISFLPSGLKLYMRLENAAFFVCEMSSVWDFKILDFVGVYESLIVTVTGIGWRMCVTHSSAWHMKTLQVPVTPRRFRFNTHHACTVQTAICRKWVLFCMAHVSRLILAFKTRTNFQWKPFLAHCKWYCPMLHLQFLGLRGRNYRLNLTLHASLVLISQFSGHCVVLCEMQAHLHTLVACAKVIAHPVQRLAHYRLPVTSPKIWHV